MVNCNNCGRNTHEEDVVINQHNANQICNLCADILLFQSSVDNLWYPRLTRVRSPNGYCTRQQLEDNELYISCGQCNSRVLHDTSYFVPIFDNLGYYIESESICSFCYDESHQQCPSCDDETARIGQFYTHRTRTIRHSVCGYCYQSAQICNHSGCNTRGSATLDQDGFCRSHGITRSATIHSYNHRVPLQLWSSDKENVIYRGKYNSRPQVYYGVELEVDTVNPPETAEEAHLLQDSRKFVFKHDGSIDGFEVVSQPFTFTALKEFPWRYALKELHDGGGRGYESGNCGIHIHVTKNAYSAINWWKALEFIYKCKAYVKMFCQRNGNYRYCEYAHPSSYEGYGTSRMKNTYPKNHNSRYVALNFGDKPTGEFRMFRSTTDIERFWSSIEFVHSLMDFCVAHGYAFIKNTSQQELWDEYCTFIKERSTCKTLRKHLIKRNLVRRGELSNA